MTQTRGKWDPLVLSRADVCIEERCRGIPCFHFLFFLFRNSDKNGHLDENDFRHVKSSFSTITRRIDNDIWNIFYSWRFYGHGSSYANSFLGKYEIKMGEGTMKIISCTKIQACSLKNIAPRYFTYYSIVIWPSNKPSF